METIYDVIIIGAGPAGLSAGLYAGRACLNTLIIENSQDGGQVASTNEIENYPGQLVNSGESGSSLAARMTEQAKEFGCTRLMDTVTEVDLEGEMKRVTCMGGSYFAKVVIIATGAHTRPIGCKNETEFRGKGISSCATCDGFFYRGKEVYVVGGGDAAVQEALFLTNFARKVTLIHRRDELRAAKSIQKKAFANPKMEFMWDSVVEEVGGEGKLQWMKVRNVKTDEVTTIEADSEDGIFGLFGFVGFLPTTELFEGKLELDDGYIVTDEDMHTGISGVFAAGDVRKKSLRQVVTAVADGAIAATQAYKYLKE